MITRILVIALNTYREAVRARLLLGIFVLALATCLYGVVVGALSLHNELRVVADLGAASMSLYAIVIAVVLCSTSLHRELELKTVFPVLSRPVRRWEYVLGKYAGAVLTVFVFLTIDLASVLALLALEGGQPGWKVGGVVALMLALLGALLLRGRSVRVYVVVPWAVALAVGLWLEAGLAGPERQLVSASAVLSLCEASIVAGVATMFASFSSPMLTAAFTTMIFVIGRSCDELAHLPRKLFGEGLAVVGRGLAHVFPNLHVYVPARPLLLGQVPGEPVWPYVGLAAAHAVLYAAGLLVIGALAFRKRDFA